MIRKIFVYARLLSWHRCRKKLSIIFILFTFQKLISQTLLVNTFDVNIYSFINEAEEFEDFRWENVQCPSLLDSPELR